MRLISTSTYGFREFEEQALPRYAILSHCWASPDEEVTFKDYKKGLKRETSGFTKTLRFCQLARDNGLEWAWIDTCCIDKRSSAELTEAINSMFSWYWNADVCYAYLSDVYEPNAWRSSLWWTRGWTLQELIAPIEIMFYDRHWRKIDTRSALSSEIGNLTGIPCSILTGSGRKSYKHWTVAQKMSWAAGRQTTRIEDKAYSLLGLFQINMPLLYGEGSKAFERLQLEILQKFADDSVLAWSSKVERSHLVLASSPDDFLGCDTMAPYQVGPLPPLLESLMPPRVSSQPRLPVPPRVTSYGIEFRSDARELFFRKHHEQKTQKNQRIWVVALASMWGGAVRDLPCILVLIQQSPSTLTFNRWDCFHNNVERVEQFKDQFIVGDLVQNMLFYLLYDSDFDY